MTRPLGRRVRSPSCSRTRAPICRRARATVDARPSCPLTTLHTHDYAPLASGPPCELLPSAPPVPWSAMPCGLPQSAERSCADRPPSEPVAKVLNERQQTTLRSATHVRSHAIVYRRSWHERGHHV